jgi:hypothetical protein
VDEGECKADGDRPGALGRVRPPSQVSRRRREESRCSPGPQSRLAPLPSLPVPCAGIRRRVPRRAA